MRTLVIVAAVFMAALMPLSVTQAAEDLDLRLNQLDAEVSRQGEIIRQQQKTVETLKEELSKAKKQELPTLPPQGLSPVAGVSGFLAATLLPIRTSPWCSIPSPRPQV